MADQHEKRIPERNIVHCPKCFKPQENLPVHLARVCMKNSTQEERTAVVKEAKKSARDWVKTARTWDYKRLCQIITHNASRHSMMKELLQMGFYVINQPHVRDMAASVAEPTSADASAVTTTADASNSSDTSQTSSVDEGISGPTWQRDPPKHNTSVRTKIMAAGLYEKFAESAPLLRDYKKYLTESLKIPNCQQEVDNVSRFLRYLQPTGDKLTLDFLKTSGDTRNYFRQLEKTEMNPATILSYMKNIIRFLDFLKFTPEFEEADKGHRERCDRFKAVIQTLRKAVSNSQSRKTVQKRCGHLIGGMKSVSQCQEILQVAKPDFLDIYKKLITDRPINENQKTVYRYYLESLIVLQNFQHPGVAEGMTVQEYVNKVSCNDRVVFGVKSHNNATQQVATFTLSMEEDAWFDAYYANIRPEHERSHCDYFFIGSTGEKVHKVRNDIRRLQEMYNVESSTSEEVRTAAETMATRHFTAGQKETVSRYLAHTTKVAEAHYQMSLPEQVTEIAELLSILNEYPTDSDDTRAGTSQPENINSKRKFSSFLETFPVSIDGSAPPAKKRKQAGFPSEDRSLTDRWHKLQRDQRTELLLSKFRHHQPTEKQFNKFVESVRWDTNKPKYENLLRLWTPPQKNDISNNPDLIKSVKTQKWRGLSIKDFGEEKRQGVIANCRFSKGEIVCDYHGKVIEASEGRAMLQAHEDEMCDLFFFKHGERDLCIDAQTFPCSCHENMETVGRMINHSKKKPNLKPIHVVLNMDGEAFDVILFKALTDIEVGTELKYN